MVKKTAKKGKRVLRKNGTSVYQLKEEMGVGFIEPVVPRPFEVVTTKIFETALSNWKLEDSQKEWS